MCHSCQWATSHHCIHSPNNLFFRVRNVYIRCGHVFSLACPLSKYINFCWLPTTQPEEYVWQCISMHAPFISFFATFLSRFNASNPTASLAFFILQAANHQLVCRPVGSSKSAPSGALWVCIKQSFTVVTFLNSTVWFQSLQHFYSSLLTFLTAPISIHIALPAVTTSKTKTADEVLAWLHIHVQLKDSTILEFDQSGWVHVYYLQCSWPQCVLLITYWSSCLSAWFTLNFNQANDWFHMTKVSYGISPAAWHPSKERPHVPSMVI